MSKKRPPVQGRPAKEATPILIWGGHVVQCPGFREPYERSFQLSAWMMLPSLYDQVIFS
jgi:hypothetical protein